MNCTTCRLPSAYNRAVVDAATEEVMGCLCTRCIEEFFGQTLSASEQEGCLLCDRPGTVALPKWRCTSVEDERTVVITGLDAPVDADTPRICEAHLEELKDSRIGVGDTDEAAEAGPRPAER